MNKLATLNTEPKPAKTRKVSRRVRHAVDLIISGEARTQKDAAAKAGLTRERFCRALKESHVIEYLDGQTRVLLAQSRAPAAATLMKLLEQARSEHVRKDVAVTLLGYGGIHATAAGGPVVNIGIGGGGVGYTIRLGGKDAEVYEGEISDVGGVEYGRPMTDTERRTGVLERSRPGPMINVTPRAGTTDEPSAEPRRKPWENGHD
jgi:hypothetical protein